MGKCSPDLTRVLVGRIVREAGKDFGEIDTPEPEERDGLAAARDLQRVWILLISKTDGPAEHLRVEASCQAPVSGQGADGDTTHFPTREERVVPGGVGRHVAHHLLHVFGVGAGALDPGLSLAELHRGDRLQGGEDPGLVLYGVDLPLEVPGRRQALAPLPLTVLILLHDVILIFTYGDVDEARLLGLEVGVEVLHGLAQLLLAFVGELLLGADGVEQVAVGVAHKVAELALPVHNRIRVDLVQVAPELGEAGQLAVLVQVEPERARDALHGPYLGRRPYAAHRVSRIYGGALARVEEVGVKEDLAVRDGDDVRRDVRRDVPSLGLDDRQRRERPASRVLRELRRAFQEPGVEVEDVPGIRLAAWRAPEEQHHLPVGDGVLGEVVVDKERIFAAVHEELADGAPRIRGQILQRRRLGGRGVHDGRVLQRARLLEGGDDARYGGVLLADGDVDAFHVLVRLVDDGVEQDRGLASLPVADDELPLPAPDRDHGIYGLDPRLERLLDRLAPDDAWRHYLHGGG